MEWVDGGKYKVVKVKDIFNLNGILKTAPRDCRFIK